MMIFYFSLDSPLLSLYQCLLDGELALCFSRKRIPSYQLIVFRGNFLVFNFLGAIFLLMKGFINGAL